MKMYQACCLPVLIFALISCAASPRKPMAPEPGITAPSERAPSPPAAPPVTSGMIERPSNAVAPQKEVTAIREIPAELKAGLMVPHMPKKPSHPTPPESQERQKIVLNYDKADISEVTAQIFADYLKLNYVLSPNLQGRISLYLEGEFTKEELLQLVTKAYESNNVAVVARKGIYVIEPITAASSGGLTVADPDMIKYGEREISPVIVIYRLAYMDAQQAVNIVKYFLTPGRPITVDTVTNSVIFSEDASNSRTILDVLKALDVNVLQDIGMEIVPLQALTPEEAVQAMETLMSKLDILKQNAFNANLAFLPLQEYGGVLVLAQSQEILKIAKRWLMALDVQGRATGEQIYVYFVQNSLAIDIADILNQVFGLRGATARERPSERIVGAVQGPEQGPQTRVREATSITTTLTGEVTIIADEVNNAIVIRANAADYEMVKRVIETLDILPRAVLIEVTIAEISLNKDLQYGVEWFFKQPNISGAFRQLGINFTEVNLEAASPTGLTLFGGKVMGDFATLLTLLAEKTHVNVLSTPTLLATDNKEATITVGGREPIQSGTTITEGGNTITSVQYEETGIILTVTPHINAGGLVRLEVDQVIRNVEAAVTTGINSPRFTERKVKTTLLGQNGSTIVIGGIIEQRDNHIKGGIPWVQNVPILSPLFSRTQKSTDRTELIIAITPHVIERRESPVTREFLEKLRTLRKRIQTGGY